MERSAIRGKLDAWFVTVAISFRAEHSHMVEGVTRAMQGVGPASEEEITKEQRKMLEVIAAWANRYACLQTVYIFGSVARGDARHDSDLDLAVAYIDNLAQDNDAVRSFTQFQAEIEESQRELTELTGRPVSLHGVPFRDYRGKDAAFDAVASGTPIAQLGKAIIVATERKQPKSS